MGERLKKSNRYRRCGRMQKTVLLRLNWRTADGNEDQEQVTGAVVCSPIVFFLFICLCLRLMQLSVLVLPCWTGIHSTHLPTSPMFTTDCGRWIYWLNKLTTSAMLALMLCYRRSVTQFCVNYREMILGPLTNLLPKHRSQRQILALLSSLMFVKLKYCHKNLTKNEQTKNRNKNSFV